MELKVADDLAAPTEFEAHPKTGAIIALLAGAALIISYLVAYCLTNALAASDVIARWKPDHDPRPKYFVISLVVLSAVFAGIGFLARTISRRQMSKIDEMENSPDEITPTTQF